MAPVKKVTAEEINAASDIITRLLIQGKYSHMKVPVQTILGGLLIPNLVELGEVDPNDPKVAKLLDTYSKAAVKEMLNPEPEVIKQFVGENGDRPIYRRREHTVNKVKRIERELDPCARDILIKWWNTNQRLVPKEDPVCAILTAQINAGTPNIEPLSSMQIAGYFSYLCRLGLKTAEDRSRLISKSMRKGSYSIEPKFSKELIQAIQDNWEFERKNEEARKKDHAKINKLIQKGEYRPVAADPLSVAGHQPIVAQF